jgi:hypothetical protein
MPVDDPKSSPVDDEKCRGTERRRETRADEDALPEKTAAA